MSLVEIQQSLVSQGFTLKDYVSRETLSDMITKLNSGEEFDPDIFEQLWNQCKENSQGLIMLHDFADTVLRAKKILMEKQEDVNGQIAEYQASKNNMEDQLKVERNYQKIQQIQRQLNQINAHLKQLKAIKAQHHLNLQIIRKPFTMDDYRKTTALRKSALQYEQFSVEVQKEPNLLADKFKIILYVTLASAILQIVVMYDRADFLNLLVYCLLAAIYLLNYFDQIYVKITLISILVSQVSDLIWLCLQAGQWWNPTSNTINPVVGYQRFCIILVVLLMLTKIVIFVMLLPFRDVDNKQRVQLELPFKIKQVIDSRPQNNLISYQIATPKI